MPQAQIWERDGTLRAIESLLSEAREGRGRSLFIVGDAGLGNTTMVERASAGVRDQFRTSIGRGDAAESSLPFGVIDQALRGLGFRSPTHSKTTRQSPPQARSARLYAALQFLDELPLLSFLCRRIGSLPVALIGTLRPWPANALDAVGPLTHDGDALVEHLQPLSEASAAEMLNDRAGGISKSSAHRAARLVAGNPLLLELEATSLRRGRALPESDGDFAGTKARLLRDRFIGVSVEEMRYAQAASVLGNRFRPVIAAAMADLSRAEGDRA